MGAGRGGDERGGFSAAAHSHEKLQTSLSLAPRVCARACVCVCPRTKTDIRVCRELKKKKKNTLTDARRINNNEQGSQSTNQLHFPKLYSLCRGGRAPFKDYPHMTLTMLLYSRPTPCTLIDL